MQNVSSFPDKKVISGINTHSAQWFERKRTMELKMELTKTQKLEKIENSIINRLEFFTGEKTNSETIWNREAIVQLSGALKKITVVRLMNEQTGEQEEGQIAQVMGMPGFME